MWPTSSGHLEPLNNQTQEGGSLMALVEEGESLMALAEDGRVTVSYWLMTKQNKTCLMRPFGQVPTVYGLHMDASV